MPAKTAVRTAASASRPSVWRVAPAGLRRLDDRVDQRHQRGRDRHRAGDVEAPLPGRRAALAQEHRAQRGHRAGDGHVDEEDPLPAEAVGDRAADQPRRGPADGAGRAPDPERLVALGALREGRHHDRQRGRGHDRRRHALHGARGEQRLARARQSGAERGQREQAGADDEHPAPPQQVGGAPAQQQQTAEAEQVGAQDPLQIPGRERQVRVDRGQRHDHDRGIEDDHEEGRAQQRQRLPAAGVGLCPVGCSWLDMHVLLCRCRRPNGRPRQDVAAGTAIWTGLGKSVSAARPGAARAPRARRRWR